MSEPSDLPEHAREFVAGLNEDDVETLKYVMRLTRDLRGLCRVTRWLVITALGAAVLIWQGIDAIKHLLAYFSRAGN